MPALPTWLRLPWFGQAPNYPPPYPPQHSPQYPQQRSMEPSDKRYLQKMSLESARSRRSVEEYKPYANPKLVKTIQVPNQDSWWDNINLGMEDEVNAMAKSNDGYATYATISNRMDHYAPALHIGTINTGEYRNPFLEDPKYRSFGIGSDFNIQDMDAFKFTPQGEHLTLDMDQLEELINSGYLPLGKRFNVDNHLITGYSVCWFGKNQKNVELLGTVDAFSSEARVAYWTQSNCGSFRQGKYELIVF